MERVSSSEGQPVVITPPQVWGEFESFQRGVQVGFKSHEQSLSSYGKLLHTLDIYLHQDQARDDPEIKALVGKMFYSHDSVAPVRMEFFVNTRDRLNTEVLKNYYLPGDWHWQEELDLVQGSVRQELHRVTYDLNQERGDRQKIEMTASRNPDPTLSAHVTEDLERAREQREGKVKTVVIGVLSKDPEFAGEIQRRDNYAGKLNQLLEQDAYTEEDLRRELLGFEDFMKREDGITGLDEMLVRLRRNQPQEIKRILTELKNDAERGDRWFQFVSHGLVPAEVLDSLDEVMVLAEFKDTVTALSGLSKEAKAHHLLPFLEKGITSGLLLEVVEGRFGLGDDLVAKQLDAFTHFYDVYREQHRKSLSPKQKLVLMGASMMVVGSLFALWINKAPQEPLDKILNEMPQEERDFFKGLKLTLDYGDGDLGEYDDESQEDLSGTGGGQTPGGSGSGGRGNSRGESNGESLLDSNNPLQEYESPRNDSPENMENEMRQVIWKLQGRDLRRFYHTHTSVHFDNKTKSWVSKNDFTTDFKDNVTYSGSSIIVFNTMRINNPWVRLPIPAEYRLSQVLTYAGVSGKPNLYRSSDGDYMIKFSRDDIGKEIQFSYDTLRRFQSDKNEDIKPPTEPELKEASRRLINPQNLPEDVQRFISEMNKRPNLSAGLKAKILEKYVETTFKYSLDTKWSDYYRQGKNTHEFVKRIFEIKRADCDVANTALVALLRSQGIPARMVFGYGHENTAVNPSDNTLTAAERHGIAQVYINGQWIYLDGTPTELDDYTKDAFEKLGLNSEQRDKASPTKGPKVEDDGLLDFFKKAVTGKDMGPDEKDMLNFIEKGLLIYLLNAASWFGTNKLRGRNNKIAERLRQEVQRRGVQYFGNDFLEARTELTRSETGRKISPNLKEYDNDLWNIFIPPAGFINSFIKIRNTLNLARLPYNNNRQVSVEQSSQPTAYDFFTSVLGYREAEAAKLLLNSAYRESRDQVIDRAYQVVQPLAKGLFNGYKFTDRIGRTFEKMAMPKNQSDWERLKEVTSERLYARYCLEYKRSAKEFERAREWWGSDKIQDYIMVREQFQTILDELFGYKLVLWQIKQARKEAIKKLDLGFKDRVLESVGRGDREVL